MRLTYCNDTLSVVMGVIAKDKMIDDVCSFYFGKRNRFTRSSFCLRRGRHCLTNYITRPLNTLTSMIHCSAIQPLKTRCCVYSRASFEISTVDVFIFQRITCRTVQEFKWKVE